MKKINEETITALIGNALRIDTNLISINSSSENVEEWDSLGHLSILESLDRHFDGKVANIIELASSKKEKKILSILRKNSLL